MRKALVIGIDKYPSASLKGCVNDASIFAGIISEHENGSPNFSVKLEKDVQTKSELKTLIKELFEGSPEIALFYFSGHGFINELGGYIVTPDHAKNDEGVSMTDILTLANESGATDKIIILDCCHSGAFGTPSITGSGVSMLKEGMVILTASRDSESALEVDGHGLFTNLLLEALRGGAADLRGHITPGSVYAYVDQALGPWNQRPVFKTNVTRFTSLREVKPPIDPTELRKICDCFPEPNQEFRLDPTYEFDNKEHAVPENVVVFKVLQKYERVGLVVPVGEEHMYYAAMNSKSCKLTPLGCHYWHLVKNKRI